MTPEMVVDISRDAVQTILMVSAPMMLAGLVVGLIIGIFQAATQINEQTMTFAPKIVAVMVALILAAPWIINLVVSYTENLYQSIASF
ncbi:MAG: flagellar biosynthesis protein FliQ [Desulfohalobiaceae bacterium]|nr:flagellar biosynthesis protein FliQ [Desulfohalobiaceae bacterium]MCF8085601.1 flagellar biosynthesis protein FliQ [Desulfohalobiaceae bacterium]